LKKVVIIGSAYPLRGGGLATFNERLARELQSEGCEVIIYTFSLQYPSFLFPGKSQYSDEPAPENLNIKVTINSINPFTWLTTGFEISKLKPDEVIIRYWLPFMAPCLGTIARIVKRNKVTRVLAVVDNMIPHEKRPGDYLLSSYFVKAVDAFIVMSEAVMNDLKKFDKIKPKELVLHPLYDNFGELVEREEACKFLNINPSFNYVLFFGFIRDYKGLDLLLKALADERLKEGNVKAIIAGEFYSSPKPYHDLIKELKLENSVVMKTDFIPNNEVKYYFSAADMVVQPYKDATQSGVTQIAFHFNKPVLVTKVGGLPEMVPHLKAGYVTEIDPSEIASAIVDFYQNNRKEQMSEFVKEFKKRYSWTNFTEVIRSLYQKLNK
jgi:D-inositol-3-phosphate glycosyltransferase